MDITDQERQQAEARLRQRLQAGPRAVAADYDTVRHRIVVQLDSGLELAFPPQLVQGLEHASAVQLTSIHISPGGQGLHFPDVDADVYLPALLQGLTGSRHWMARALGQAGGARTSPAKARAARNNGKLGGRPRTNS